MANLASTVSHTPKINQSLHEPYYKGSSRTLQHFSNSEISQICQTQQCHHLELMETFWNIILAAAK